MWGLTYAATYDLSDAADFGLAQTSGGKRRGLHDGGSWGMSSRGPGWYDDVAKISELEKRLKTSAEKVTSTATTDGTATASTTTASLTLSSLLSHIYT